MFTREELFEYFSDRYSKEQVEAALITLHEKSSIDPKAEEYPASITDKLEQVFDIVSDAIASSKQLPGSTLATVEQTAVKLAGDRHLDISLDVIQGIISIVDAEAAVEAYALHERRKAVREGVLTQLEMNDLAEANEQAAKRIDGLRQLCKDPDVLDQILADYNLLPQDEASREHLQLTASCSLEFDPEKFLSEVNPEKKPQVRAIADTQRLAKALITRALK